VNLSLGAASGSIYPGPCTDAYAAPFRAAFAAARAAGVVPVVSAGNDYAVGGLSWPACAPEAVSVGATFDRANADWTFFCNSQTTRDGVACFSNNAHHVSLLAPGCEVRAGQDGSGGALFKCGTSQAAPHIAGAVAVLKAAVPSATPDQIVKALQDAGTPVTDYRDSSIVRPRLGNLKAAVEALRGMAARGA
jgi:subtilisin family serine protease